MKLIFLIFKMSQCCIRDTLQFFQSTAEEKKRDDPQGLKSKLNTKGKTTKYREHKGLRSGKRELNKPVKVRDNKKQVG